MKKRILATVLVVAFMFVFLLSAVAFAADYKIPEVPSKPVKPVPNPIIIIPPPRPVPVKPIPVPVVPIKPVKPGLPVYILE